MKRLTDVCGACGIDLSTAYVLGFMLVGAPAITLLMQAYLVYKTLKIEKLLKSVKGDEGKC